MVAVAKKSNTNAYNSAGRFSGYSRAAGAGGTKATPGGLAGWVPGQEPVTWDTIPGSTPASAPTPPPGRGGGRRPTGGDAYNGPLTPRAAEATATATDGAPCACKARARTLLYVGAAALGGAAFYRWWSR